MRVWALIFGLIATAAYAAESVYHERLTASKRIIESNAIPNHMPGQFPNRGNPHRIEAQSFRFEMPLYPKMNAGSIQLDRSLFGVAVNGVPFDPGTAETWENRRDTIWRVEGIHPTQGGQLGLDVHNAHVQPTGTYHYHGIPHGLVASQAKKGTRLIGYAADGFPIYAPRDNYQSSYRLKAGSRPGGSDAPSGRYDGTYTPDFEYVEGLGNLDACNGQFASTNEHPDGIYHYVLTETFPYIPRCFMGTPDHSFRKANMGGGGRGGEGGMRSHGHRHPHPHRHPHRF